MILNQILFYFFAALAIGSAILMVTRRNIVHSAVFLISTLLATAGIFLQLQAEFLFVVQIILYVGGIMVLFIFVIMLVNLDVALRQFQFNRQKYVAAVLTLVLAAQVFFALWVARAGLNLANPADKMPVRNTEAIGDAIFQRYMLPFEIASVLHQKYPEHFDVTKILPLLGSDSTIQQLQGGTPIEDIIAGWAKDMAAYDAVRRRYFLYK